MASWQGSGLGDLVPSPTLLSACRLGGSPTHPSQLGARFGADGVGKALSLGKREGPSQPVLQQQQPVLEGDPGRAS